MSLAAFSYRLTGIRTPGRPDYYEWFPIFGDIELANRARYFSLDRATLHIPRNIERLRELGTPSTALVEAHRWSPGGCPFEWLRELGFSRPIVDGFRAVDRSRFLPAGYEQYAWLNASLPISEFTWLSAIGIVALINEAILQARPEAIVEIGTGTGYQTATLAAMLPGVPIASYEVNLAAAVEAEIRLADLSSINVRKEPFATDRWPSNNAVIFATAKLSADRYEQMSALLLSGQTLIAPRWLFESEFEKFSSNETFARMYPTYSEYTRISDYLALSATNLVNGRIVENIICYDVNFVDFHTDVFKDSADMGDFYRRLAGQVGF